MRKWERHKRELRIWFEELFPKDNPTKLGLRPSRSNRSSALIIWVEWEKILEEVIKEYEKN